MLVSFFSIFFIYNLIFLRNKNLNFLYEDINLFLYFLFMPLDERYDGEAQSVDQLRAALRALRGLRPLEGLAIAILALLVLGAVAALVLARLPRRAARRGSPEESAELARA